jgi:hypothetical protein
LHRHSALIAASEGTIEVMRQQAGPSREQLFDRIFPGAFATAAATLGDQGDLALALDIITPGLLRHPGSSELAELRQAVVIRLMEQRQLLDPFGFLVYAELAGAELPAVG